MFIYKSSRKIKHPAAIFITAIAMLALAGCGSASNSFVLDFYKTVLADRNADAAGLMVCNPNVARNLSSAFVSRNPPEVKDISISKTTSLEVSKANQANGITEMVEYQISYSYHYQSAQGESWLQGHSRAVVSKINGQTCVSSVSLG